MNRIYQYSTRFEPWQQRQCAIAANPLEIGFRKTELRQAFSRLTKWHEWIVAAKENLCGWDETGECRNRWPITSKNHVFGRREENAGAAGLSPDTVINAVGLGPFVVARVQLLVADHQLSVKQMQFFDSGVAVTRIVGSRREPYQHADAVFLHIGREQFAGDARRHFFPFRFSR